MTGALYDAPWAELLAVFPGLEGDLLELGRRPALGLLMEQADGAEWIASRVDARTECGPEGGRV